MKERIAEAQRTGDEAAAAKAQASLERMRGRKRRASSKRRSIVASATNEGEEWALREYMKDRDRKANDRAMAAADGSPSKEADVDAGPPTKRNRKLKLSIHTVEGDVFARQPSASLHCRHGCLDTPAKPVQIVSGRRPIMG